MLYLKRIIILILLIISIQNNAFSAPADDNFLGVWCWDQDSNTSVFSIYIKKKSGLYVGSYGSVIESGDRIDDNDDAFNFRSSKRNRVKVKIKAGITDNTGLIQLTLLNNKKIEWIVLHKPQGEFLPPLKAILHKCK